MPCLQNRRQKSFLGDVEIWNTSSRESVASCNIRLASGLSMSTCHQIRQISEEVAH